MKFHIYDIDNLRQKVEIDMSEYKSLDHYLYANPYLKRLVYAYIKQISDETIQLSKIHRLFKDTTSINFYEDQVKILSANNTEFQKIIQTYVQNPYTWVNGSMQAQSYFFDAKHLLNGEYQAPINEVVDYALRSSNLHYSIGETNFYQFQNYNFYQSWFTSKKQIENHFFNNLLNSIPRTFEDKQTYKIQCYHDIIEIFDTDTDLTLQFLIKSYTNTTMKILMPKEANRSSIGKRNTLVSKFLMKSETAEKIYRWLIANENLLTINDYIESLENLSTMPQFKLMSTVVSTFLNDVKNKEKSTYIGTDWIALQMHHQNSVERNIIHFSDKNALLRIYRKITLYDKNANSVETKLPMLELKPYSIPKNLDRAAKQLLNHGFITFSRSDDKLNQLTFENLAIGHTANEAKLFMRLPIIDAKAIYDLAEVKLHKLAETVKDALENEIDLEFDDTRIYKTSNRELSTYFETIQYINNKTEFEQSRQELNIEKTNLINSYINNNHGLFNLINTLTKQHQENESNIN